MDTSRARRWWRRPRWDAAKFSALALLASLGGAVGSCSVGVPHPVACMSNVECRGPFGLGSVCTRDGAQVGYCSEPQRIPRCSLAYPDDLLTNSARYPNHIIIGSLFDYVAHAPEMHSAELAVRQVNAAGGLEGRMFGIVHCDYGTSSANDMMTDIQATQQGAHYLADVLGVAAIIGPRGTDRTIATFNSVPARSVVIMTPGSTSIQLTALDNTSPTDDNPGLLWRTSPPDSLQVRAVVADMRARMISRVAVLYEAGTFGEGFAQSFAEQYAGPGVTVTTTPFMGAQLGDGIARIGASDAEEVLFISANTPVFVAFLNGAAATPSLLDQYRNRNLFLSASGYHQMVLTGASATAQQLFPRVRGTRPAPANGTQLYNAFAADYMLQYGASADLAAYTSTSYDGAWLLLYGIAWSHYSTNGQITGLGIARGLRHVSSGRAVELRPATWLTAVDAFRTGQSVNVAGASGALDFDPATEETSGPVELWRMQMSGASWTYVRDHLVDP
jgi:ABC-type branched-subunit amino acid transport system substrate-binding protein